MGKKGELWDDSALIEAYDHAISKYKVMHGSTAGEKAITDIQQTIPDSESNEFSSETEHVQNDNNLCAEVTAITSDAANTLQIKEISPLELDSSAKCESSSNIQNNDPSPSNEIPAAESSFPVKDLISSDVKSQNEATWCSNDAEGYNQLLSKYYEIEGQRQNILQQLNQYSNYYQNPSTSISEEYPSSVPEPYDTVTCYCPYGCQNWIVPCNSLPASCSGASCNDKSCNVNSKGSENENENPVSTEDSDFVQTAMIAAKRALSSVTKEASGNAQMLTNGGKDKGHFTESTKSATDLDVVLNAWYSAGFYTGKYLSEQSLEKRRHGQGH